ncbi:MAG: Bacterial antitoxin of ParD toxin-antitoxin type system [Phycisphaerales bacterium]|jgi:Arc/MetJ-type ribon-helix-helix transcriptional regulator|nr:Bacterial antitoxin of ParD toxin-antitoxin type system [Phycisphaerales bacterium]
MQVELTKPELAKFIDEKVKAGEFPSPEAVVENALALMMENEETLSEGDIRAIDEAEGQFERGEFVEFDVFAAEMRKKYRAE